MLNLASGTVRTPASTEDSVGSNPRRLEAREIECWRGDQCLFRDLSFGVSPGDIVQIEGANGSGKTTLLRILCGLTLPDEGEVYWDGAPIRKVRDTFYAATSYVGHNDGVKGELTPVENLRMDRALATARAEMSPEQAIERLGLPGRGDVLCRRLSAGQRRRVALARLLVTHCELWILDEPLTALDMRGRATVEELLIEHARAGGMVVFTTHHGLPLHGYGVKSVDLDARP